jgi:four helix bundle protein
MKSAGSVHANIAEGYTRGTLRDYLHFLDMARASLAELESHLYFMVENELFERQKYEEIDALASEVGNILVGLMRSLAPKLKDGTWSRIAEDIPPYLAQSSFDEFLPTSSFLLADGGEG